jgi:putative endonuclease
MLSDPAARTACKTAAEARGRAAEARIAARLAAEGWTILGQRIRTPAGEIDLVAESGGLLAFIEVKARDTLLDAAHALGRRQQRRLIAAAEIWLGENPGHGTAGVRFDVLLVDAAGGTRRIADAFRIE